MIGSASAAMLSLHGVATSIRVQIYEPAQHAQSRSSRMYVPVTLVLLL